LTHLEHLLKGQEQISAQWEAFLPQAQAAAAAAAAAEEGAQQKMKQQQQQSLA